MVPSSAPDGRSLNLRWGGRIGPTLPAGIVRRIPPGRTRYGATVFDERAATIAELRPLAIHGMAYVDVVLALEGGGTLSARLGPEAMPAELAVGDAVVAISVMANVIELRRPAG